MHGPVRSLYIHVPFCFHKCHYCDFYSIVDTRDRQHAFAARLIRELEAIAPWASGAPLQTVFVGGGTPSLLRVELWKPLLESIESHFDLSIIHAGEGEFTVECNPETVTPELMQTLRAGGVNRVSIGAQSFEPTHLKTLQRWHNPENVERALAMARAAGIIRSSVDLIFAIPGQTFSQWRADLDRAVGLRTEHLSCYNLTYESNTAMTARLRRGEFQPAPEELEVEMYQLALQTLRSAGFDRYEVSNYSHAGAEARHNLAYWKQDQWLAAGPSACAHVAGHRWKNVARLDDYLERDDDGFAPIQDHESPDTARLLREKIMTGLRLRDGVCSATRDSVLDWCERTDIGSARRLRQATDRHVDAGWMEHGSWKLTDAGMLFADRIAADLMRHVPNAQHSHE